MGRPIRSARTSIESVRRTVPLPDFDCYAELGVEPWADDATIEAAWRNGRRIGQRQGFDPTTDVAVAAFARLETAHEWLSDPSRRSRYDEARWPRAPLPVVPDIDPLGAWPARRPRPRPPSWLVPSIVAV